MPWHLLHAGLFWAQFTFMLTVAMNRWLVGQLFELFLGVFVTLGMSLSVAQVGAMPVKMTMSSVMSASGHGDCNDCGSSGDADAKAMSCKGVCVTPVLVALSQDLPAISISLETLSPLPKALLALGWASPPDPYPPRPHIVG